jgi:hypothetical protein
MNMRPISLLTVLIACTGENVIEKQENSAPTITIQSHSDDTEMLEGYTESFRAQASDDDHDFEDLEVAWFVGEQEVCAWEIVSSAGESFCDIVFTPDDTSVVAEVRDVQGAGGRDEVNITVASTEAPVVEILSPVNTNNYYADQLIQFSAILSDAEDLPEDLIAVWSSNIDGELDLNNTPDSSGEISDFSYLSEGEHAIQLLVEDTTGKTTSEELVIIVGGNNNEPLCDITEPNTGSGYVVGQNISFSGTATDEDINNSLLSITWESNQDGTFDTTAANTAGEMTVVYGGLSIGNHIITLRVADEVGGLCTDTVNLSVGTPPSLTLTSPTSGDVVSLGNAITFAGTVTDNEDIPSAITISWVSDIDGEFSTQGSDSSGNISFSQNNLTAGLHNINITATDSTGLTELTSISLRVNTPPPAPTLSITPDPAYTTDNLTVNLASSTDADGDIITYTYLWYVDGNITTNNTATVLASQTTLGEQWLVRVTPNDGYVNGAYTEVSASIINSDPVLSTVSISPTTSVYNDTVLTCTATATDADETVTPTMEWTVGTTSYSGATLDLSNTSAMPTDSITCTATVVDSNGGTDSGNASVTVENRTPSISSIAITPTTNVMTNSSLTCAAIVSDPDGEILSPTYEWMVGTNSIGSGDTITLTNTSVQPGDIVTCQGTIVDNYGESATDSTDVTVVNSLPSVDSIGITPTAPGRYDTITCAATASDIDGGAPSFYFAFSNQTTGVSYTATTVGTQDATLDLSTTSASANDVLQCVAMASDANGGSTSDVATVTVINTAPVFSVGATITPSTGVYNGTNLTCTATATDVDDGAITPSFEWTSGGASLGTGNSYTVNPTDTSVGDSINCIATAVDNDGETTTSTAVVIVTNTAPTLSSVSISPSTVYNDTTVTCSASATDPDETVSISYSWAIAGVTAGSTSSLDLSTTSAMPTDTVECIASVVDSNGGSDTDFATVAIDNRAPTAPTMGITPSNPVEAIDDLICSASGSTDADGQSVTYTYTWTSDSGANVSGDTVSASLTAAGEVWTCTVEVSDGIISTIATASVVMQTEECSIDSSHFPSTISSSNYGLGDVSFDGDCNIWSLHYQPAIIVKRDAFTGSMQTVTLPPSGLLAITYSPTDDLIYVVSSSKELYSIDPYNLSYNYLFTLSYEIESLEIVPDTFSTTYAGLLAGGTSNGSVVTIDPSSQQVNTLVSVTSGQVSDIQFDSTGYLYVTKSSTLLQVDSAGSITTLYSSFSEADGVAIDEAGQRIFVADSGPDKLYEYDMVSGTVQDIGSYDFDSGYFTSGLLYGANGVLLMLTGENSQTQVTITP